MKEALNFNDKISEFISLDGKKYDDINVYEDEKKRTIGSNKKLRLLLSMVKIGDWKNALLLMNKLPEHYAVSHNQISDAFYLLLHHIIDPLFLKYVFALIISNI